MQVQTAEPKTKTLYPGIVLELDELRGQWKSTKIVEGALLAAATVAAVLLAVVVADNVFKLSPVGRFAMAVVLWGGLAVSVMSLVVRRWLEDHRDDFFAALVEKSHPELDNRLINALQLGRGNDHGSPRIVAAIVSDAANATADLDMADCLDWRPVKRALVAAAVVALLLAGYGLLFAPRFANGLARVMLPLADIPPYTATQIMEALIKPASGARFPEGAPVAFEVKIAGVVPATATLYRSMDGKNWRTTAMRPDPKRGEVFQFAVSEASDGFQFYIAAGDDRSDERAIQVVKRPQVEGLATNYTFPDYTGREPLQLDDADGEIAALVGTKVRLDLRSTKPLHEASLETESGEIIPLAQQSDAQGWACSFVLWSDKGQAGTATDGHMLSAPTRYKIKLVDTDGYENAEPLWRSITLVNDQAPSVVISTPGKDVQVKPEDKLPLAIEARDDFGLADVRIEYRVNDEQSVRELTTFAHSGPPELKTSNTYEWNLAGTGLKSGDLVVYWASATDRNVVTGPGRSESRRYSIFIVTPEQVLAELEVAMDDYAAVLEELIRLQRENRAQTASGFAFADLVTRQTTIRTQTSRLARAMAKGALPVETIVESLNELYAGLMADVIRLLESGRDTGDAAKANTLRDQSLPVQDEIIERLSELLARLQRNEHARKELRRIEKKDKPAHEAITKALSALVENLDRMLVDESQLADKLEKMPKRPVEEFNEEDLATLKELDEFQKKWMKWAKGTVDDLTKLPTGFVDDFAMREDVNRVFEEIEATSRKPVEKSDIALEDMGVANATKMKEDLETWMPDFPDNLKWTMEEPLNPNPLSPPEMPLPDALEDLIGELLQEADEFDEEADDQTSAWGDNLDQAGWLVADGPISNFSAKGKTGNDIPNNNEATGRAGDGRQGKSSGQMVGDTSRALEGRKTPARLSNERYEPGQLKQEDQADPAGVTGGGKKAGSGERGLQGGTPPDFLRDMGRLSEKQAGLREKAEQIAKQLDTSTVTSRRLTQAIDLMKSVEGDLRDLRYDDAARKRRIAIGQMKAAFNQLDATSGVSLNRAYQLPSELRQELVQSADEGFPKGYESLLESYYRALSEAEK